MYYAVRNKEDPHLFVHQEKGLVSFRFCTLYHFEEATAFRSFVRDLPAQMELVHVEFRTVTNASLFN